MGKKRREETKANGGTSLAALFSSTATNDPVLEALFSRKNAGPLPPRKPIRAIPEPVVQTKPEKEEANQASEEEETIQFVPAPASVQPEKKSKKRKRQQHDEDSKVDEIESRYLKKVNSKVTKSQNQQQQQQQLGAIQEQPHAPIKAKDETIEPYVNDPVPNEEQNDITASETEEEENPSNIIHESLALEPSAEDRTIFLSNLPIKVLGSKPLLRSLKSLLSQFGPLSSLRFRSIAFSAPTPKRVSFIHKAFHPERDSANAYAVYKKQESVAGAVEALNGFVWEGKHLRVDSVGNPGVKDHKRSVFVGNLPFDVQDEDVWNTFERCGEIEFVRIVRDKKTNVGKGFGYVQFKDRDSVDKAVLLNDKPSKTIKRHLRVTYAKAESRLSKDKLRVGINMNAARFRLKHKNEKKNSNIKEKVVLEGKRAKKDKSGGSGFKIGKKRGKMRLVETRKKSRK